MTCRAAALLWLCAVVEGQIVIPGTLGSQLKFVGDWQTGDWDADAAEHVAIDGTRAFVASAADAEIQVVSILDPTSITQVGSVSLGAMLGAFCVEEDCIYEEMDFGGFGAPCGYAPVAKIIHDRSDFTCCGWHDGPFEIDENMTSPEACQQRCAEDFTCSFWSYENECEFNSTSGTCSDVRHHECYLKTQYAAADGGDECIAYVVWEEGPHWDRHDYDENWSAAAGPAACDYVKVESAQSVTVVRDLGAYPNGVLVAAAPHAFPWADGYLGFFDATTLQYLDCEPAGNKPESLHSYGTTIACANEGSGRGDGLLEHAGSTTVCELVPAVGKPLDFNCTNYDFEEKNFVDGAFVSPVVFRSRGVRLYGPDADYVGLDLEPESVAFLQNGSVLVVSFQDNNAYAFLDLTMSPPKYTYLGGYDLLPATLDASDKDGVIGIKSSFGNDSTPVFGLAMPDVIVSFTVDGVDYVITANEGDTRDGGDIIGAAVATDGTEIEGEESRYGELGVPPVATCDGGCELEGELGRVLTTVFTPSDFAFNACGGNACDAQTLADALSGNFSCLYEFYDYGRGGLDSLFPCGFAPNPADAYVVSDPEWVPPSWYSGSVAVDLNMTTPKACQDACAAAAECDFFSFEWELGVGECLFKLQLEDCPYEPYTRWAQKWDDPEWKGWSGPAVCDFERPLYSSVMKENATTGSDGGSYVIGGRSFTLWKFVDTESPMELVFDSGSAFEELTSRVNGGLCDLCFDPLTAEGCAESCPFNSDSAPPTLDSRSDAKGPEPEAATVGVTSDGKVLVFVSLERTGGVVVYDVSDPAAPKFQDFLNVRNWLVNETTVPAEDDPEYGPYMIQKGLNDGPEHLVFVNAEDSPVGQDILFAVSPLAGRLTAYIIEQDMPVRENDGSCPNTASCPYLSVEDGGTGEARNLTLADVCNCDGVNAPCCVFK